MRQWFITTAAVQRLKALSFPGRRFKSMTAHQHLIPVYYHNLDPKPENAFPKLLPSHNFFEYQARITSILNKLREHSDEFALHELTSFEREDIITQILRVHDEKYIHWLEHVYDETKEPIIADTFPSSAYRTRLPTKSPLRLLAGYWGFDSWTPVVELTFQAAVLSASCAVQGARDLLSGRSNVSYSVCRPPGHHASSTKFGGYCYLNSAAIAARVLQAESGRQKPRVAIFDCDYHHGNGTQDIFYEDGSVLYVSIHADPETGGEPFYVGYDDETGLGEGIGTNLNIPLSWPIKDDVYITAMTKAMAAIKAFHAEYLVVSLGVDIYQDDPLSEFGGISLQGFSAIGQHVGALRIPTAVVQEGGYNAQMTGECVKNFFDGFRTVALNGVEIK